MPTRKPDDIRKVPIDPAKWNAFLAQLRQPTDGAETLSGDVLPDMNIHDVIGRTLPYQCVPCGRGFINASTFHKHAMDQHVCVDCHALVVHQMADHDLFVCPKRVVAAKVVNYAPCPHCGVFYSDVPRHVSFDRCAERVCCPRCTQKILPERLDQHLQVCNPSKPRPRCPVCSKKLRVNGVTDHIQKVHPHYIPKTGA